MMGRFVVVPERRSLIRDLALRLSGTTNRIYSRMAEWRLVSRMNRYTTSDTAMQPVK